MTDQHILWLDLETTGISDDAQILEIGMIITKGLDEEVARFTQAIKPQDFNPMDLPDPVFDMHMKSGLIAAIRQGGTSPSRGYHLADDWIRATCPDAALGQVSLGGSGIDRYDVPLLRRVWPALAAWFHWRTIDVSTTKRLLEMAGHEIEVPAGAHRALDDCEWAIDIARKARDLFGDGKSHRGQREALMDFLKGRS